MASQQEHLENLSEIRNLMERSSRFISLSGLSGVFAGTIALIGAGAAIWFTRIHPLQSRLYSHSDSDFVLSPTRSIDINAVNTNIQNFIILDALAVLVLSIGFGIYFTTRKARKKGLPIWDATARRLMLNLFLPLTAGGIFCLILMYHHMYQLVAPATLLFYGLALINAGKYTLNDIRYLGITEIVIGLLATFYWGYGLLFWIIGFGVMHIIYGGIMYWKYER